MVVVPLVTTFLAALAVSPVSSVESPARRCRDVHISTQRCEQELGAFPAAQFLTAYALKKLHSPITDGSTRYCRFARRDRPWIYRCGIAVEPGGVLSAPCTVEALVRRERPKVFRILWKTESAACNAE